MKEPSRIDYHSGFAGGLELFLWDHRDALLLEREHYLSKEPLRADFLIIKKDMDLRLHDSIGEFFLTYHVIEYKRPDFGEMRKPPSR